MGDLPWVITPKHVLLRGWVVVLIRRWRLFFSRSRATMWSVSSWRTGTTQMKTASVMAAEDYKDVAAVADQIGIPTTLSTLKRVLGSRFWVFPSWIPCRAHAKSRCYANKEIKFKAFWLCHDLGADYVATGTMPEWAWWGRDSSHASWRDNGKDQTYFSASFRKNNSKTMFPLGHLKSLKCEN